MKRNLEIIRYILLEIEKSDEDYVEMDELVNDVYSARVISHHIKLLIDCGYIEAESSGVLSDGPTYFAIDRITSAGYDYLDNVRNSHVWKETKNQLAKVGTSVSLDLVKAVSSKIILRLIGL